MGIQAIDEGLDGRPVIARQRVHADFYGRTHRDTYSLRRH
jgi:hypothetical protein